MAILTDYLEPKVLDHIFGNGEYTATNTYLGLSATAFVDADTASSAYAKEPSGNGYARIRVDNKLQYVDANDRVENFTGIDFAAASGSWGNIQYWGIFDGSANTANLLMHGSFSSGVTVSSGSQFRIATGDFQITLPTAIGKSGTTYVADNPNWERQLAYRLGLHITTAETNNAYEQFTYLSSSSSEMHESHLFLAVSTSAFSLTGLTSAESSGTGYSRQLIAYNNSGTPVTSFGAATTSSGTTSIANNTAISFPEAGSDWGDIAYWAIFRGSYSSGSTTARSDGASYYNASSFNSSVYSKIPLFTGSLTTTKTVSQGDRLRFGVGDFVIQVT